MAIIGHIAATWCEVRVEDQPQWLRGAGIRAGGNPAPHLAGRFAVKEAAMKALGTGLSQGVGWKDIEVVRGGGPPRLELHGGAERRAAVMQVRRSLVTITHSESLAMAQVMLIGD